jgi:hypothetical protein
MSDRVREHNRSIRAIGVGFMCEGCEELIQDGQEWLRKMEVIWHVLCERCAEPGDERP